MGSGFMRFGFVPALGSCLRQGGVQDRGVGCAGCHLCLADRVCARNLVVKFPVRRTAVVTLAPTVPVLVAAFVLVAAGGAVLAHLDICHRTAVELVADELLDDVHIFGVTWRGQHQRHTAASGAAGAANAM